MSVSGIAESANLIHYDDARVVDWETSSKIAALTLASYLTDPVCKVREYFCNFYILDKICHSLSEKVARVAFLVFGMAVCALLTPLTAPAGLAIRGLVASLQTKPFIYWENGRPGKALPITRQLTVFAQNQCEMPAGYSITDGQVTPSSDPERMQANIEKIRQQNCDIANIYEICDIRDALYYASQLPEYPYVICGAGVRALGPSSMMLVLSKYQPVETSIEFIPFEKDVELTGRAKWSGKGFLSFDIKGAGETAPFASIVSTHLQHSEIPASATPDDVRSRALQMRKIARKVDEKVRAHLNVIITGDFNAEEKELEVPPDWRRDESIRGRPTWGGDGWCASLEGKQASGPLVLDYAFIAGKTLSIVTQIEETGYRENEFIVWATSDHYALINKLVIDL